ncbi:MAG: Hpt domain-containing protein [Bacillota bacterium]|nr:Hpt domain-containing protein [Bacillota bacterium]
MTLEELYRAAHTLKGVCQNMGFGSLAESTSELTEILRAENSSIPDEAYETLERVKCDYNITSEAIRAVE